MHPYTVFHTKSVAIYVVLFCTENIIVPPPQVQALCSVVVWDNPAVSCRDIIGYDVRFYSLQLVTQNVTRRVGANGTYYIVQDKDRLNIEQKDIYVQVIIPLYRSQNQIDIYITLIWCRFESFIEPSESGVKEYRWVSC